MIVDRVRWADTHTHGVKDRLLDVTHRKCEVVVKEVEHTRKTEVEVYPRTRLSILYIVNALYILFFVSHNVQRIGISSDHL